MKSYLSIFVISFILISSNTSYAQFEDFVPQNLINAPGVFNFNSANSITGNQTKEEWDSDGDGTVDLIYTYTYDANGNQTRYERDSDGDGTVRSKSTTYTFDANGNQTRYESMILMETAQSDRNLLLTPMMRMEIKQGDERDSDGDGTADEITTYTYDANGNQTRYERDSDGDGTSDRIYTYTYDANGNQTRREYDSDGDGTADRIETYTFDANGNRTRSE